MKRIDDLVGATVRRTEGQAMSKHIWIIEELGKDWVPCLGALFSRAKARSRKCTRQEFFPGARFRVAKYIRVGRSEGKEVQGG